MCFLTSEIRQLKLARWGLRGAVRATRPPSRAVTFAHPSWEAGGRPGAVRLSGTLFLLWEEESYCLSNNATCFHTKRWQVGGVTLLYISHILLAEALVPGAGGREGTEAASVPGLDFQGRKSPRGMCLRFDRPTRGADPVVGQTGPFLFAGS